MKLDTHSNRVLITGIEGFTGNHLEKFLLQKGYQVYGTSRNPTKNNHFRADITKIEEIEALLKKIKPNFIIHLAGIAFVASKEALNFYNVNLIGSENLLKAVVKTSLKPEKILLASSAIVYGNQNSSILTEEMIPSPINHYSISKYGMELIARTYFDKLNIIIGRFFNYTGVGQNINFLIPKIVQHYKERKKSIELGNLDVEREFNDVRDVISIFEKLLLSPFSGDVVNISSGRAISLLKIIEIMNRLASYQIEVKTNPLFIRENEIKVISGSTKKLSKIIDLKFNYSIEDTLKEMFNG